MLDSYFVIFVIESPRFEAFNDFVRCRMSDKMLNSLKEKDIEFRRKTRIMDCDFVSEDITCELIE